MRILSFVTSPSVTILRYHSVREDPSLHEDYINRGITHSTEEFEREMAILAMNYSPITLDYLYSCLKQNQSLPKNSVIVTFDDGFADNFLYAAPIMERYGLRGAFYITAGCIDSSPPPWFCRLKHAFHATTVTQWSDHEGMTWNLLDSEEKQNAFRSACGRCAVLTKDSLSSAVGQLEKDLDVEMHWDGKERLMMTASEIRELDARGHTIGSHGVDHANIAHIPESCVRREMRESKVILENILGHEVRHFSYPSPILQPHYTDQTTAICRENGYATAVTCKSGACSRKDDPLVIPRISASQDPLEMHWAIENTFLGRRI